jgi:histidine triad (HIT) family protein
MSLAGEYDEQNIFARVLRGEAPCVKVLETPTVLAFMDVFPQSQGHLLVVSKTSKARNLLDIDPDALCQVMAATQACARAVVAALKPDGVVITQFNGAPAGQTVFHLHVHVIPRWADRPLRPHAGGGMAPVEELRRTAAAIAAAL